MSRPAARQHRLPKRTDYRLIPAPLDLSLPLATEKSPLPAIIVTPSSPSSTRDFSIAFLAAPPKPSLRERLFPAAPSLPTLPAPQLQLGKTPARARALVLLLVLAAILACHALTHALAARYPRLDFAVQVPTPDAHAVGWFVRGDAAAAAGEPAVLVAAAPPVLAAGAADAGPGDAL